MNNQFLAEFLLHIGDSQLILSHRLAEWSGHAPELELDIALSNIALDLLGQARTALSLASELEDLGRNEDQLAFFRTEREYRNLLLTEQPNNDFGQTIVRQWLMDHYHVLLFAALTNSQNQNISSFATKSLKEVKYHLRFSTSWMERLSLGTQEAHDKIQNGLTRLWRFTDELFDLTKNEEQLVNSYLIADLKLLKPVWQEIVRAELLRFSLTIPSEGAYRSGSKQGLHTEHLGFILAELQYMQRTYPNMSW